MLRGGGGRYYIGFCYIFFDFVFFLRRLDIVWYIRSDYSSVLHKLPNESVMAQINKDHEKTRSKHVPHHYRHHSQSFPVTYS